jgi:hypothetical protein
VEAEVQHALVAPSLLPSRRITTTSSLFVGYQRSYKPELRLLLERGSFGSRAPVHLRGAGKVTEIRGHQNHDVFHDESRVVSNLSSNLKLLLTLRSRSG